MAFRFNYGAEAVGRALPDLERAAYDQQSFAAALELQKVQRANQAMDLDNARSILQIRDTRIRRDLEQQRADQQQRAQGIAWRNQIAALGGRALPPDQQPGANDIVQVDPFTGDRFAYTSPEAKQRMAQTVDARNRYAVGGFVDAMPDQPPPRDAIAVTLPDGTQMYKMPPSAERGFHKAGSMVQYFKDREEALGRDFAGYDKQIKSRLREEISTLKLMQNPSKLMTDRLKQLEEFEKDDQYTAREIASNQKLMRQALQWWAQQGDRVVPLEEVPPQYLPAYEAGSKAEVAQAVEAGEQVIDDIEGGLKVVIGQNAAIVSDPAMPAMKVEVPREQALVALGYTQLLRGNEQMYQPAMVQKLTALTKDGIVGGTGLTPDEFKAMLYTEDAAMATMAEDYMTVMMEFVMNKSSIDAEDMQAFGETVARIKRAAAQQNLQKVSGGQAR